MPATPPASIGKKKGKGAKGKSKKKAAAGEARLPGGRKDTIATHCAAILRFLALCPGFTEELLGRWAHCGTHCLPACLPLGKAMLGSAHST